jgi:hypothetical protein
VKRRALLRRVSVVGAVAVAGCSGSDGDAADTTTDETATTDESTNSTTTRESPTETTCETTDSPTVTGSSFTVESAGCGQQVDDATVAFAREASAVTVDGTIAGSDTCKRARLRSVSYDAGAKRLDVVVETFTDTAEGETPVCGQCIVEIDYRARVEFEHALPEEVRVTHAGMGGETTVTTGYLPES